MSISDYQMRPAAYAGVPAGISDVADINATVANHRSANAVENAMGKALATSNRDTVLWVRELRRRMFITQMDMAKLIGISSGRISLMESGRARPNDKEVRKHLERLGAQYGMPKLPEVKFSPTLTPGPYFPSTLEAEFKAQFGE